MAKTYWMKFGSGDPRTNTGLAPTMVIFNAGGLTAAIAPGVTETPAGSGLYSFSFGATISYAFLADGGAGLASGDRYITGVLDPVQAVDERVGVQADSYGSTAADPTTLTGYLKRLQEVLEGDAVFTKSTGVWSISSRGATTLLVTKTLTNTTTSATKA